VNQEQNSFWSAWLKAGAFIQQTFGSFNEVIETEHLKVRCHHPSVSSYVDLDLKRFQISNDATGESFIIAVAVCPCKKLYIKIIKEE
jgi:hypothetical protein